MKGIALWLFGAMTVYFCAGCAIDPTKYQWPQGDPASLATIRMSEPTLGVMRIDSTNQISFREFCGLSDYGFLRPTTYIVTPGKHTFTPLYASQFGSPLWFVAEAGKEYLLRSELSETRGSFFWKAWLEDEAGNEIGGYVGSDDEPTSNAPARLTAQARPVKVGPAKIFFICNLWAYTGTVKDNGKTVGTFDSKGLASFRPMTDSTRYVVWEREPGRMTLTVEGKIHDMFDQKYEPKRCELFVKSGERYYIIMDPCRDARCPRQPHVSSEQTAASVLSQSRKKLEEL